MDTKRGSLHYTSETSARMASQENHKKESIKNTTIQAKKRKKKIYKSYDWSQQIYVHIQKRVVRRVGYGEKKGK